MTLYEKLKKLDIELSQLGIEQRETYSGYFCTPKGAKVLGWEGVGGIHYCFVKGFGETVFAVNPSNLPGDYVHPLAWSFEDFLRLLLACGGTAAIEQTWMWNRREFDAFIEAYPPGPEQQTALDIMRDKLHLTPIDDPYGYIKNVQSSFDYGKIPCKKEYYGLLPKEPNTQEPLERPDWKVYFAKGFCSRHSGHDKPGQEIHLNKTFSWGGKIWHVPAVYVCGKGMVADLCVEIAPNHLRAFLDKWMPRHKEGIIFTPEEEEQQNAENPMTLDYNPKLTVNGKKLHRRSGNGFGWVPMSCHPVEEREGYNQQNHEAILLMEQYGLDPEMGWMFWRDSFPWATKKKPVVKTISLALAQEPVSVPGFRFTVSGAGDVVPFTHPVTGEPHTLKVMEYGDHMLDISLFEYPTNYTAMSYVIEPELPKESFKVRDCIQGVKVPEVLDRVSGAMAAYSVGIIGGEDGPTAIISANSKPSQHHAACSALHFEMPEEVKWQMVFYQKTVENMEIDLL